MRSASQRKYQNHNVNQGKFPRPKFRKAPKVFTPLRESQTQLYERLKAMGMLHPIEGRPANPLGKFYRADHRCAYHSGAIGHDTENCSTLKHKIQNMINNNLIDIEETPWMDGILDTQEWVQDISELSRLKIFIIKGREEECPILPNFANEVLLPFFWKSITHFLFELRSTSFLKNEIRRRPMSASVVSLSKLPILVNPWEGNYVWPDSCSNGIRRRHNGSVIIPSKISISLHNGNWDRIFEMNLKLDFFNKSKQKTKILRRLALGGSQKLRQSSLQLGQNFWDDLKNSTNIICYLLR